MYVISRSIGSAIRACVDKGIAIDDDDSKIKKYTGGEKLIKWQRTRDYGGVYVERRKNKKTAP